jgi:hypothetical protein
LFHGYVELASDGEPSAAYERLAEARAPAAPGAAALVDVSDDARTAVRLIEAELAARGAARGVLVVGPEARWFVPPDGPACHLGSRQVLRRLLLCFVSRHREAPAALRPQAAVAAPSGALPHRSGGAGAP